MEGFSFSQDLINRTIAYYKTRGESITPETAHEYLLAMSSLYESFMAFAGCEPTPATDHETGDRLSGVGSGGGGGRSPSADLINSTHKTHTT